MVICVLSFLKDQETVSKLAELDLVVADLERANTRIVTAERRNVRDLFLYEIKMVKQYS